MDLGLIGRYQTTKNRYKIATMLFNYFSILLGAGKVLYNIVPTNIIVKQKAVVVRAVASNQAVVATDPRR